MESTGLLDGAGGLVVGAWEDRRGRLHRFAEARDRHVLAFAPSGSGKSTCLVVPTLLEWPGSVVALDIKGELWHLTAAYRRERLGNPVRALRSGVRRRQRRRLQPAAGHPARGRGGQVRAEPRRRGGRPRGARPAAHLWEQSAHALLVGCILHVLYAERDKSLAGCARLLSDPGRPVREALKAILHCHHDSELERGWREARGGATPTRLVVAAAARAVLDLDPRTASGVIGNAQSRLDLFRDPILAANTAASDFAAEELVGGERPVALYITVAPAELDRLRGLLRIVLNQLCRRLTERLEFSVVQT